MSMHYDPWLVRALTCERIREARGRCEDDHTFDLARREPAPAGRRRLFERRSTPAPCAC
jgi:hypothetical protein